MPKDYINDIYKVGEIVPNEWGETLMCEAEVMVCGRKLTIEFTTTPEEWVDKKGIEKFVKAEMRKIRRGE